MSSFIPFQMTNEGDDDVARREWRIMLTTVVTPTNNNTALLSDALGVTEFDPTARFVATAGIARKIRLYPLAPLLPPVATCRSPVFLDHNTAGATSCIVTAAKISSLKWKPNTGGRVIGSGDYDGVVMEYDIETRKPVFERDEHGGRRVLTLDYTEHSNLGASGSDDGSMQLWDARCDKGRCVGAVFPSTTCSAVCSVEFEPDNGLAVAVGCADKKAYLFDLRKMAVPALTLEGHSKTVTYVKFSDRDKVVSSSVDGQLRLWDVGREARTVRVFEGHVNRRNFVGLSVWRKRGLVATGCEDNKVVVYDVRKSAPVWMHEGLSGGGRDDIVCSVSWNQAACWGDRCMLAAGDSCGVLKIFECVRASNISGTDVSC